MSSLRVRYAGVVGAGVVVSAALLGIVSVMAPNAAPLDPRPVGTFSGPAYSVADGDTLRVVWSGKAYSVRLARVDAPEKKQPFGPQARAYLISLVSKKTLTVTPTTVDFYGRLVGDVSLPDGSSIEQKLVAAGLAWHYDAFDPDDPQGLEVVEATARAAHRGLWTDPSPVEPSAWRAAHTNPQ
jgi:endonuclease YncB( thermonuclease family)